MGGLSGQSKKEGIQKLLESHLHPVFLQIIDESALHKGHAGIPDGQQETHFRIRIQSPDLDGLSLIVQHKRIYGALQTYFDRGEIHALSIEVLPQL